MVNEFTALDGTTFQTTLDTPQNEACDADRVHEFILSRLPNDDQVLARAASYHFERPGKMLRAKMAMRSAQVLGVNQQAAMRWAAAIEVLHNASLIHDDICDNDRQRRGRDSIWAKYGQNLALALGDWLIALSFDLTAEAAQITHTPRLVSILAKHMAVTTAGEAMEFEWNGSDSWDVYLTIAADKTAPLLTAPIQGIAAMAGDATAEDTITLYFRDLGKAYQIANDIRNYTGLDGAKSIAGDLARRTPNAVTLSFMEQLDDAPRAKFADWYNGDDIQDLGEWLSTIQKSGAMDKAAIRMLETLDGAGMRVKTLPPGVSSVIKPVYALIERFCESSFQNAVPSHNCYSAMATRVHHTQGTAK